MSSRKREEDMVERTTSLEIAERIGGQHQQQEDSDEYAIAWRGRLNGRWVWF